MVFCICGGLHVLFFFDPNPEEAMGFMARAFFFHARGGLRARSHARASMLIPSSVATSCHPGPIHGPMASLTRPKPNAWVHGIAYEAH